MSASSLSNMFEDEEGGSAWVVTFADMMTLILVFFILLYTLADFEDEAYKELIESVQVIDGDGSQISVIDFATRKGRNPEPLKAVEDMLGMNPGTVPVDTVKPALVSNAMAIAGPRLSGLASSDSIWIKPISVPSIPKDGAYIAILRNTSCTM